MKVASLEYVVPVCVTRMANVVLIHSHWLGTYGLWRLSFLRFTTFSIIFFLRQNEETFVATLRYLFLTRR